MSVERRPRRPVVTEELLKKAKYAEPPSRLPRGFFDPLMPVVRRLLDNGLKIYQAADWLVEQGTLPSRHRLLFMAAMRMRFSRLRAGRVTGGAAWKTSIFYESAHAVTEDGTALCGSRASVWEPLNGGAVRCYRCLGIVTKKNVTITGDI